MIGTTKTCRILSIDGGGIRGVIPATILVELEKQLGAPLARHFHMIAGTSTGGILACGLANEIPAQKLLDLYAKNGSAIFTSSWGDGLDGPKYDPAPLEAALKVAFGDTRLSALSHDLLSPAYDIEKRVDVVFRSWRARGVDSKVPAKDDFLVREVARCTAAAPTYFPPAMATASDGTKYALIDGGMLANDPALLAFASARRLMPLADRYLVLSIGTGQQGLAPIPYTDAVGYGLVGWAPKVVDVLFDAVGGATSYALDQMDTVDHMRWQASLDGASDAMDDATSGNIAALGACATRLLKAQAAQVASVVSELSTPLPDRIGLGYPKTTDPVRPPTVRQFPKLMVIARARAVVARVQDGASWPVWGGAAGAMLGATLLVGGPLGLVAGGILGALGGVGARKAVGGLGARRDVVGGAAPSRGPRHCSPKRKPPTSAAVHRSPLAISKPRAFRRSGSASSRSRPTATGSIRSGTQ